MQLFTAIPRSKSTPEVSFDPVERRMKITGESYPENSFVFYAPILEWVHQYLSAVDELHLEINVSYMNSSSTKCILDLLDLCEEAHKRNQVISMIWHYDQENPRSLDLAEEFSEEVTLPFNIVAFNE